jgi:hypothetical protein
MERTWLQGRQLEQQGLRVEACRIDKSGGLRGVVGYGDIARD